MPRSIEQGFKDFLLRLTPTDTESEAAKRHRQSIKTRLELEFGYVPRFARIGSFGNGTSISGFSDVDYLACLPRTQLTQNSNSTLQKLRTTLDARFPNTGVHVDCPAVVCPFGTTRSETTEIVPADEMSESGNHKIYDIPDCKGGWMKASPDAHNEYVRAVDAKHSGKVKPLIRFVKAWKYYRQVPISSFYLELRVARYAAAETAIIYDIDVKNIFCRLRDNNLADMQDPAGVSGYISACSSEATHADALSKLSTAATRAEKAREAATSDKMSEAFSWWRLLYNDEFPSYYY